MLGNIKEYDFVCSLGGNCSAANNLKNRELRVNAFPFDWIYYKSDKAIYLIADSFKDKFKNYMQKDNLKKLPVNNSHLGFVQYEDTFGNIIWANHFKKDIFENPNEYLEVKNKIDKRFNRFLSSIDKSKDILFLFVTDFSTELDSFKYLHSELKKIYPDKNFEIKIVSFDCEKDDYIKEDNIERFMYKRHQNTYDFSKTNNEWSFLDNVKIRGKKKNRISISIAKYKIKIEWGIRQ